MFFLLITYFIISVSQAREYGNTEYWQGDKKIYVEPARIVMDSKKGTSIQLNYSLYSIASSTGAFKDRLNHNLAHLSYEGEVMIYTPENLFLLKDCDWISKSLQCAIENNIWLLRTTIVVGDKYSTVNIMLYDHDGQIVSSSDKTIKGTIMWKPQWKLTSIKSNSAYGQESKEIFEQWPHKMEEFPPLIMPRHIRQVILGVYLGM